MKHDVERCESEQRVLRTRVETLETENYQLRARLSLCTCGAAAELAAPASTPNEQQLDLIEQLGCLYCD
jgi:hypothetical protein